jgi:hypothetical protein
MELFGKRAMSRTKLQTIGLLLIVALLGFVLVCGLCIGDAQAQQHQVMPDCILFTAVSSSSTGQLSKNIVSTAPPALFALVSLAFAFAPSEDILDFRSPTLLKTVSTRRNLAQLQILVI